MAAVIELGGAGVSTLWRQTAVLYPVVLRLFNTPHSARGPYYLFDFNHGECHFALLLVQFIAVRPASPTVSNALSLLIVMVGVSATKRVATAAPSCGCTRRTNSENAAYSILTSGPKYLAP